MELTWAAIIGIPASLVALSSLLQALPWTDRRFHLKQVDDLSKVIKAADDEGPKILVAKLAQEVHWVEACYVIRPRVRITAPSMFAGILAGFAQMLLTPVAIYELATSGLPIALIMVASAAWLYSYLALGEITYRTGYFREGTRASRRLYAKTAGKVQFLPPKPRGPLILLGKWTPFLTSPLVDALLAKHFGRSDPDLKKLEGPKLAALRRDLDEIFTRKPLPQRRRKSGSSPGNG